MKIAIYIEDGVTQLVLTPDSEWERDVIRKITEGDQACMIKRASFYECRGGWNRMSEGGDQNSLIIRTDIRVKAKGDLV